MERLVRLHSGEDEVEEDGHGQEEDELHPQRDEAGRLLRARGVWSR